VHTILFSDSLRRPDRGFGKKDVHCMPSVRVGKYTSFFALALL
jgi:hypothetical protein